MVHSRLFLVRQPPRFICSGPRLKPKLWPITGRARRCATGATKSSSYTRHVRPGPRRYKNNLMYGSEIVMNANLSEQLKKWKAEEWQRHLARYVEVDHNPDAPENKLRNGKPTGASQSRTLSPRANQISWKHFSRYMGVDPNYLYQLGAQAEPGTARW
jgi:hypothetical protein